MELELPSGRLHATTHGPENGPLTLCAHGLSANGRAFDLIAEPLAAAGRRVVALDLRGRGRSEVTPPGTYGLAAHGQDILDAADALGADEFDLVGWSMGALIGIELAQTASQRLRSLVLLDAAGRIDASAVDAVRAGLARLGAVVDRPEDYVAAIRNVSPIREWSPFWDAFYTHELAQREDGKWAPTTNRAACEEDLGQVSADDWRDQWAKLETRVLLVRCSVPINDGFIVPADERDSLVATAPDARAVEVDVNHFEVMADPATIAAVAEHIT